MSDSTRRAVEKMTVFGRLYQARMWREYARAFDGHPTANGIDREWLETIGHVTRSECIRRARINVYLARRLNRSGVSTRRSGKTIGEVGE